MPTMRRKLNADAIGRVEVLVVSEEPMMKSAAEHLTMRIAMVALPTMVDWQNLRRVLVQEGIPRHCLPRSLLALVS